MKFFASILNGDLRFQEPGELSAFLAKADGAVTVSISRSKSRSNEANSLYWSKWGPLQLLADHTGDPIDLWHDRCKIAFIPIVFGAEPVSWGKLTDEQIRRYAQMFTTTQMSVDEFSRYLRLVSQMAFDRFQIVTGLE